MNKNDKEIIPVFTNKKQNCKNCGYCYFYKTGVDQDTSMITHEIYCIRMMRNKLLPKMIGYRCFSEDEKLKLTCNEHKKSKIDRKLDCMEVVNINLINALYFYYRDNEDLKNE